MLLLDDIQFIIGKEQTQEGFFHTFNALHMAGKQIVITCDRPVSELSLLQDRVSSRLAGGLVVDIQIPDLETRLAILRSKAEQIDREFPNNVLEFIAGRVQRNVRELEGCLNIVAAYAGLGHKTLNGATDSDVDLDLVEQALEDSLKESARRVSEEDVLSAVARYFSIDKSTLKGKRSATGRQRSAACINVPAARGSQLPLLPSDGSWAAETTRRLSCMPEDRASARGRHGWLRRDLRTFASLLRRSPLPFCADVVEMTGQLGDGSSSPSTGGFPTSPAVHGPLAFDDRVLETLAILLDCSRRCQYTRSRSAHRKMN